jgi:hypothetical protein
MKTPPLLPKLTLLNAALLVTPENKAFAFAIAPETVRC